MSGSFVDANAEAKAADMAAAQAGLAPAVARFENAQAAAEAFVAAHGEAVLNGHSVVGYLPAFIAIGE